VPLQPQTFEKKQDTDATNGDISSQAPQMPNVFSSNKDKENKHGGLVAIKDRPRLLEYGCLARIVRVQRSGVNLFGVFVEGVARFKVNAYSVRNDDASKPFHGCLFANVKYHSEMATSIDCDNEVLQFKELCRHFVTRMRELQLPETLLQQLTKIVETSAVTQLADLLVSLIETTFEERLLMLKTDTLKDRLEKATSWITRQIQVLQISDSFGPSVDGKLSRKQREFYLRQQVK
jgi:ATP-dependent Lon protease